VARRLLREPQILLAAEGARRFARERGAELCDERDFARIKDPKYQRTVEKISDTVGCVALDIHASVAAGTSTGGLSGKPPGRVGDSPLPGAGFYADNTSGGASFSGIGEHIARVLGAACAMRALESWDAQTAAEESIAAVRRVGGGAGVIVIDKRGGIGWAHDTPQFAVAYATAHTSPIAALARHELAPFR
jgi:beta-aspartyl-peptidase (threonine type)